MRSVHVSWTGTDRESYAQEVKKSHLAGKALNLNGRSGNGYGDLCQIVQMNPEERSGSCVLVRSPPPRDSR
jgi:hypothetical protein